MAADQVVTAIVDQLIELFNQRSMDLPDGSLSRNTQFLLNGVPFEEMLGRRPDDPLVLMLTRGPAGYRFTAKAVQHAVPDARLERGELNESTNGDTRVVTGQCWLSGHYRGTGEPVDLIVDVEMRFRGSALAHANVAVEPARLQKLHESRLRP
jgi:hypothetical protein